MYFVNREKIEQTLDYYQTLLKHFQEMGNVKTVIEELALERITYVLIESIIDVGNSMIDGFIMRDPGGYEDIIDILEDESVINSEHADSLKSVIRCRKSLVQDYTTLDHMFFERTLTENMQALAGFPEAIKEYLNHELGPVSAFLPQDK